MRPLTTERITLIIQTLEHMIRAKKFSAPGRDGQSGLLPGDLRDDYLRLVDVYRVVQAGGTKAMLYRLDTGHRLMSPDYFADLSAEILTEEDRTRHWDGVSTSSLTNLLRSISANEEEAVTRMIPQLQSLVRTIHSFASPIALDVPGAFTDVTRKLS